MKKETWMNSEQPAICNAPAQLREGGKSSGGSAASARQQRSSRVGPIGMGEQRSRARSDHEPSPSMNVGQDVEKDLREISNCSWAKRVSGNEEPT